MTAPINVMVFIIVIGIDRTRPPAVFVVICFTVLDFTFPLSCWMGAVTFVGNLFSFWPWSSLVVVNVNEVDVTEMMDKRPVCT